MVDLATVDAGHPFKGIRANTPHAGAHVHFDNTTNKWPSGGTAPSNYPAIYAVADGTIDRVDTHFQVGANYRYGFDLAFARSATGTVLFSYSVEPMIDPGDSAFYQRFILVHPGQSVLKGDVLGYMYVPPGAAIGAHIHFHLQMKDSGSGFMAPAIFTPTLVADFHARWNTFALDGTTPMPACMGYMLAAAENPFGTGQQDCL